MGKIQIFKSVNNEQYYFKILAKNGEPLVVSEGYTTKQNCLKGLDSLKENIKSDIDDLT